MTPLQVLFEDNHLLVINKPSGLATMGSETGPTLHSLGCSYLKKKYHKPGNVYLGVVSRLDAMTSGVIVFARTSKAATRLNQQFSGTQKKVANKVYLALVKGNLPVGTTAHWSDHVYKDDAAHRMKASPQRHAGTKEASLSWTSLHSHGAWSLVAVKIHTGRKHQIRLQFSLRDHAVLGDRKYDCTKPFSQGIALHSWSLTIDHPTQKDSMTFHAPPPDNWRPYLDQISAENHPVSDASLPSRVQSILDR